MNRGSYILDTVKYQCQDEDDTKDQVVSHFWSLSKLNSLKGIYYSCNRNMLILEQLQESLDNLSSLMLDLKELVAFFDA